MKPPVKNHPYPSSRHSLVKRIACILIAAVLLITMVGGSLYTVFAEEPAGSSDTAGKSDVAGQSDTTDPDPGAGDEEDRFTVTPRLYSASPNRIHPNDLATVKVRITDQRIKITADMLDSDGRLKEEVYNGISLSGALDTSLVEFVETSDTEIKLDSATRSSQFQEGQAFTYIVAFEDIRYRGGDGILGYHLDLSIGGQNYRAYDLRTIVDNCTNSSRDSGSGSSSSDDDDDDTDPADPTPYIIVMSYDYGGSEIAAGQEFPLTISFYNTSAKVDVENIIMKLTMPEGLMLTNSSNTVYIPWLSRKQKMEKSFQVKASPTVDQGSYQVELSFKYQYLSGNTRQDHESGESIAIPVVQLDRFQVDAPTLPESINVGEEYYLSITYVNKSRTQIYNLSGGITGSNLQNPGQQQHLGNLEAGKDGSIDFSILANEPGEVSGEIILSYEDANMTPKQVTIPYTIPVIDSAPSGIGSMDMGDIDSMYPMEEPEPTVLDNLRAHWQIYAGVLVGAIILLKLVSRIIRRRKEAALLADDDDETI